MQLDTPWTPRKVAEALVRAYRLLEGHPVLSGGGGFSVDGKGVDPSALAAYVGARRFVTDPWELRIVRTWATCVAQRESINARYKGYGWQPRTAERRRLKALVRIAAGLNGQASQVGLDNVQT